MKRIVAKPAGQILLGTLAAILLGVLLPLLDGDSLTIPAWFAYFVLSLISIGLISLAWLFMNHNQRAPIWLLAVVLGAWLLRLGVGFALHGALPEFGNAEQAERAEQAGYVYWDAYKRDTDAWDRGRGEVPLILSFTAPKASDQYGGMIFTSALIYRYLGTEQHRPTMPLVLFSAIGALAALFTWGFSRNVFDESIGALAAGVVALYPEAVLLSASQMREPFLMTGFAIGLFGYSLIRNQERVKGVLWILLPALILILPISPPFLLPYALILLVLWLWDSERIPRAFWIVAPIVGFVLLAIVIFVARSWAGLDSIEGTTMQVVAAWLENLTAQWRVTQVASQSDWMDTITDFLPDSLQVPFLVAFGLLQPLLPAALAAPGAPVWKALAVWRGLGWFVMLPLLIFATIWSVRQVGWRSTPFVLVLIIWLSVLAASYRAPSYQWDNPRYRAVFIAMQATLVAWAWVSARRSGTRLLRHVLVLFAGGTLIFTYWYLGRYTGLPEISLIDNFGFITGFSTLYLLAVIVWERRLKRMAM